MDQNGPFWSTLVSQMLKSSSEVILTKMVVWAILDHFGPVHFPTVPRTAAQSWPTFCLSYEFVRVASLQNQSAPECFLKSTRRRVWKPRKIDAKNDPKPVRKRFLLPLIGRWKIFHRHFSKNASPPKEGVATLRICSRRHFLLGPKKSAKFPPNLPQDIPCKKSRKIHRRASPKNLFGLFLTFRVISILQGYFWRPSENTL